ncbi:MAG: hypothetical protein E6356_17935 [Terrisporobacter othiniensis]|nr:hypothetical protein [Terrisporobacter othiniensis]MDU6996734.1 hypothetical protein [Terrisporobacter othiniensis]
MRIFKLWIYCSESSPSIHKRRILGITRLYSLVVSFTLPFSTRLDEYTYLVNHYYNGVLSKRISKVFH